MFTLFLIVYIEINGAKDDAKEVLIGMKCGLTVKNYNDIKAGAIVEAYEEEEVKSIL